MSEYIMECNLDAQVGEYAYKRKAEIVRCRDCKHYGLGRRCEWSCRFVKPDGFCAWGERREHA